MTADTTKTARNTARRHIRMDIDDAINLVRYAEKLLPHARLDDPDELADKLTAAREALTAAQGAFEEAVNA